MKTKLFLSCILGILLISCKEKFDDLGYAHARFFDVWIIEPGDPALNNSTISRFSPYNDSVWFDAYQDVTGHPLGAYVSFGFTVADEVWLFLAHDNAIMILNSEDMSTIQRIENISSPLCAELVEDKVYVGSREQALMYRIDIHSKSVQAVKLSYPNVSSLLYSDVHSDRSIFIACHDTSCSYVYKYGLDQGEVTDSFLLSQVAPKNLAGDYTWVEVLTGHSEYNIPYKISALSRHVAWTITREIDLDPSQEVIKFEDKKEQSITPSDLLLTIKKNRSASLISRLSVPSVGGLSFFIGSQTIRCDSCLILNFFENNEENLYVVSIDDRDVVWAHRFDASLRNANLSSTTALRDSNSLFLFPRK